MKPGFYKLDQDNNLLYAASYVSSPDYTLTVEDKDSYTLPIGGWYFFLSEQEAKDFFGITDA